jgi:hypothetical protein
MDIYTDSALGFLGRIRAQTGQDIVAGTNVEHLDKMLASPAKEARAVIK